MPAIPRAALLVASLLVACAGAVPDPAAMVADLPPVREVSPERRAELDLEVEQARVELLAGRPSRARTMVQRVLEFDPRHARARALLGHCHLLTASETVPPRLEEFRLAEGELRRASELDPTDPLIASLHAGFLVADGHLSAAADRVATGLAAAPHEAGLLELGGRINFDLGNERAAIPLLAERIELVPTDVDSVWRLAQCQARLCAGASDADERGLRARAAATAFHRYGELAPQDVEAPLGEAWALLQSLPSDPEPSAVQPVIDLYERAARMRPESVDAHFGRALALGRAGRKSEMRDALRETMALDPRHVGAVLELAADAVNDDRLVEARQLYVRASELELSPDERRRVTAWLASPQGQARRP